MPITPKQQPPYYQPGTSGSGLKQFIALLEQDSTNAPTITILINTFEETITPGYDAPGAYNLSKTTPFLPLKTTVITQQSDYDGLTFYHAYPDNDGKIYITTRLWSSPNWSLANDIMNRMAIIITEYP